MATQAFQPRPSDAGQTRPLVTLFFLLLVAGAGWLLWPGSEAFEQPADNAKEQASEGGEGKSGIAPEERIPSLPEQGSSQDPGKTPQKGSPSGKGLRVSGKELEGRRLADYLHRLETRLLDPNAKLRDRLEALEELVRNEQSRERAYQEIAELMTRHQDRKMVEGALDIAKRNPSPKLRAAPLVEAFDTRFRQDEAFRLKVIETMAANKKNPDMREQLEYLRRKHTSGPLQAALDDALRR